MIAANDNLAAARSRAIGWRGRLDAAVRGWGSHVLAHAGARREHEGRA